VHDVGLRHLLHNDWAEFSFQAHVPFFCELAALPQPGTVLRGPCTCWRLVECACLHSLFLVQYLLFCRAAAALPLAIHAGTCKFDSLVLLLASLVYNVSWCATGGEARLGLCLLCLAYSSVVPK
jgi:hypothetical protein